MADAPWEKRLNDVPSQFRASAFKCTLGADQNSEALQFGHITDRCLQVVGDFFGGVVTVEGTNDWEDTPVWSQLHDVGGDLISLSAAGMVQVLENSAKMRVVVTGGDDGDDVTEILAFLHMARS